MNNLATTGGTEIIAPDQFIQKAIESGSSVEVLSGLYDLKQRHEAAEAKKAFIRAMQKFQEIKPSLKKGSKVNFSTSKGTTDYNFCSLPDIEKALKEPLTTCGLTYRFENLNKDGSFGIRCVNTHVDGHSESTEMYAPRDDSGNKNQIQGIGSTSTYLMRYTLIASYALTTADEDNDGFSSGELPFARLLEHNEVVRDNMQVILAIKESLAADDLESAAMYLYEMGKDTATSLWIAPTKGGIFTTKERELMKSDEFAKERTKYLESKGDNA